MNMIPNINQYENQMMNVNMINKDSNLDQDFYAFIQQSNMQNIKQPSGMHFSNIIPKYRQS